MYNTPIMASAFPTAQPSNKSKSARELLESQIRTGAQRQHHIVHMVSKMHILDALVPPSDMTFQYEKGLSVHFHDKEYQVHSHALGQMSQVLGYPGSYVKRLQGGVAGIPRSLCHEKLTSDLNWHAHNSRLKDRKGEPARYLTRSVDGEIRGYLSRSFKRHLASKPLLRAFLSSCAQAGLEPLDGHASPVRVNLQCSLPYVFEPFDGEFLAVGVAWTNSDFGSGRMKVSMYMKRIKGESSVVVSDAISEVHIGPVIEEADIEMSEETYKAELEAQRSAIGDAVVGQMRPDKIQNLLDAVRVAHEEKLPWYKLRNELGRVLQKKEVQEMGKLLQGDTGYEELPPVPYDEDGDPVPTRWWASAVLGKFAEREGNAERKKELQEAAGTLLGKAKKKK
jgi:hypothetical protein